MTWQRLDRRTIAVHCAWLVAPLASFVLTLLATGGAVGVRGWLTLAGITLAFLVITIYGVLRLTTTRYRISASTFELNTGVLHRRRRSIVLERVRNVDLTASPVHRVLGLVVLRAGTAASDGGKELVLDALPRATAHRLREELLARADRTHADDPVIATMHWKWLRYAPLTFWVFGGVLIVAGAATRALNGLDIKWWEIGIVQDAFAAFGHSALWLTIPLLALGLTLLGMIGAIAVYVETWWSYRLEWTDAETLQVRRGLLTTRAVSIERRRLRGSRLREPLLLRAGGGALVDAVAGGLGNQEETRRRSSVLPPSPRAEAARVALEVLGLPQGTDPSLRKHPEVAQRRRVVRGFVFVTLPITFVLLLLGFLLTTVLLHVAWIFFLVTAPVAVWMGRDAYRNLGHGISGSHLVIRSGVFSRDTVLLEREGVLSWSFSSNPFSRRAGLVTATAAVAAGEQGYRIRDLAESDAVDFAEAVTPNFLTEFLARPSREVLG
ncbi:PH domain-containing protein [Allokutzneria sp. A3M-2-11 16]|uniref:PH domain-containing protein n=1 Tax=Allokutzneria sp. A3M-2-11 16 TaxID=2962043 RepID=UPI0020B65198|nr:PH domain-containing protein [Allokutzneria sp. A3M-2-11 16]MCP3799302.1 PH domain-containing protein [Allokutzneria sp. A3M-2-11 16]